MLVATLTGVESITFSQQEVPAPKAGEVLLRVVRMGICGSDIHAYYGKHPTVFTPIVQGHEFSAVVEDLGEGVTGFTQGQKVTVRPQHQCGECYYCRHGMPNVCKKLKVIGCQTPGGAEEYLCVPAGLVFALPDSIDFDEGAMVEPLAVAVANLRAISGGIEGKRLLVLGGGTIGNLTAQAAKALGADLVAVTDVVDGKLALARACGIDRTINTGSEDIAQAAKDIFGEDGPDAILECVGLETTVNQAIAVARKGTEIIIIGIYSQPPRVDMLNVQEKELNLKGVLMYLIEDYHRAIALVSEKSIRLAPLFSAHFSLGEMEQAYSYIAAHPDTCMKVLLDVGEA